MSDPLLTIKDALVSNWDSTNTSGITPEIDIESPDNVGTLPNGGVVIIGNYDSNPINGGDTGYDGMGSNGPTQTIIGTADVNTIVTANCTSVDPQKLTTQFSEEVKRILTNNAIKTNLAVVGWGGKLEGNETDINPIRYRYICEATFTR